MTIRLSTLVDDSTLQFQPRAHMKGLQKIFSNAHKSTGTRFFYKKLVYKKLVLRRPKF